MTTKETIKKLENRYHVHIDRETFTSMYGYDRESFKVYSADGCQWDNVISYRCLVKMLAEDKAILARIAKA